MRPFQSIAAGTAVWFRESLHAAEDRNRRMSTSSLPLGLIRLAIYQTPVLWHFTGRTTSAVKSRQGYMKGLSVSVRVIVSFKHPYLCLKSVPVQTENKSLGAERRPIVDSRPYGRLER